jgi:hypothetical protein
MIRAWLVPAVAASVLGTAACGGDAFTAGSGATDGGTMHDGSPPADVVSGSDAPIDAPASCTGDFACVPAAPAGWDGPLELYSGTVAPPACSTGFTTSVSAYDLLQASAATCGCACGSSDTTCTTPSIEFYDSTTCGTGSPCATEILSPGVCTTLDETSHCPGAAVLDITLVPGNAAFGACTPQPTKKVPPYAWGLQARSCTPTVAPSQANCASGQTCAPLAGAGFVQELCIGHLGDVACPAGAYGVKHVFYTTVVDLRGCTACTCAAPSGGSCDFTVDTYQSTTIACTGGEISYGQGTMCAGVDQPGDFRLTLTPTAGSCAASNSAPTGSATPAGAVTVCCPM